MIRPFTCLCMLLAGGSGLYLYQEKHRTTLLDREIARTIHATAATHAQTEQLRADYAVLNQPERLRGLADHFLSLPTMQPAQWVQWGQWNDLASRLPAPRTQPASDVAPGGGTDEDIAAAEAPATDQPAAPVAPVAPAAPAAPATLQVAAAQAPRAVAPAHPAPVPASPALPASLPTPPRAAAPKVVVASPGAAVPAAPVVAGATADAHAATHRVAHAEPARPHELAAHDAHEPAVREASVQSPSRPIMAPVLSALAGPMHSYAAAPVVSRTAAMVPVQHAGAAYGGASGMTASYGSPIVSAIGGVRGSLPAPTPIAAATPYGGDR